MLGIAALPLKSRLDMTHLSTSFGLVLTSGGAIPHEIRKIG
jgi:hypothetical protein